MAYFDRDDQGDQDHRRVFRQPVTDAGDEDALDEGDPDELLLYDEYAAREEKTWRRRDRWRLLAGVGDFIGVILGAVVILVLVLLLISLVTWVQADITQSFTLWQTKL